MHLITQLLAALGISHVNVGAVLAILGSASVVSVVLQIVKHFGKLQDAQRIVMLLLGLLSVGASYADQVLAFNSSHPKLLSGMLMVIVTVAVYVHRFAVSPVYAKVTNFLNGVYADATAYRQEQAQIQAQNAPQQNSQEFKLPS